MFLTILVASNFVVVEVLIIHDPVVLNIQLGKSQSHRAARRKRCPHLSKYFDNQARAATVSLHATLRHACVRAECHSQENLPCIQNSAGGRRSRRCVASWTPAAPPRPQRFLDPPAAGPHCACAAGAAAFVSRFGVNLGICWIPGIGGIILGLFVGASGGVGRAASAGVSEASGLLHTLSDGLSYIEQLVEHEPACMTTDTRASYGLKFVEKQSRKRRTAACQRRFAADCKTYPPAPVHTAYRVEAVRHAAFSPPRQYYPYPRAAGTPRVLPCCR
jgi:hypothetical protein